MFNEQQPQHEMLLETIHPTGAEEWFCPVCGRRFLLHWPPNYNLIVLDPGDDFANHTGWKGDTGFLNPPSSGIDGSLHADNHELIHQPEITNGQGGSREVDQVDSEAMRDWLEWLDQIGFDQWWERELK